VPIAQPFHILAQSLQSAFGLLLAIPLNYSVGNGEEATRLICDGVIPEDFWQGCGM
jgi:hypothetical protein